MCLDYDVHILFQHNLFPDWGAIGLQSISTMTEYLFLASTDCFKHITFYMQQSVKMLVDDKMLHNRSEEPNTKIPVSFIDSTP